MFRCIIWSCNLFCTVWYRRTSGSSWWWRNNPIHRVTQTSVMPLILSIRFCYEFYFLVRGQLQLLLVSLIDPLIVWLREIVWLRQSGHEEISSQNGRTPFGDTSGSEHWATNGNLINWVVSTAHLIILKQTGMHAIKHQATHYWRRREILLGDIWIWQSAEHKLVLQKWRRRL